MAAIQTQPWDAATHLRTEEDMIAYLDAVLAENDPVLNAAALSDVSRAQDRSATDAKSEEHDGS